MRERVSVCVYLQLILLRARPRSLEFYRLHFLPQLTNFALQINNTLLMLARFIHEPRTLLFQIGALLLQRCAACINSCVYICKYICICVNVFMYICINIYFMDIYIYIYMCILFQIGALLLQRCAACINSCVYICKYICICVHVCMYICINIYFMNIYIYIYMYTFSDRSTSSSALRCPYKYMCICIYTYLYV